MTNVTAKAIEVAVVFVHVEITRGGYKSWTAWLGVIRDDRAEENGNAVTFLVACKTTNFAA
jgi:hypothetical protein